MIHGNKRSGEVPAISRFHLGSSSTMKDMARQMSGANHPSLSNQTSEEGGGGGGDGGGGSGSKLGTEDAEEITEDEIELRFQQMIPLVAQQIARMEVTSPEVVRVTPVFRTFEKGAVAFRKECAGDFYFKSESSEKISTFWSHSWHGGHWKLSWDSDECNPFVLCDETILIIFGSQNSLAILIGNIRIKPLELLHNLRTILTMMLALYKRP